MNNSLSMDNKMIAELWNKGSDDWYKDHKKHLAEIIANPEIAFPKEVFRMLKDAFNSFDGLNVCVPSSGDNMAVFAFYLLGANVTSVDISSHQINNGQTIAKDNHWDIKFVCDDSMTLGKLEGESYDLIYTSNGVHVWISNLTMMYQQFYRLLKPNGQYVFFDTHPITRVFDDDMNVVKKYSFKKVEDHEIKKYEWRTQDFINSLSDAKFSINKMVEFNSTKNDFIKHDYVYDTVEERVSDECKQYDWKVNPSAALPHCFGMMAEK